MNKTHTAATSKHNALAQVEVNLLRVKEVADSAWGGNDAMNAHPLDGLDLATLIFSTCSTTHRARKKLPDSRVRSIDGRCGDRQGIIEGNS